MTARRATGPQLALVGVGVIMLAIAAKNARTRARRAVSLYIEEVSSGSRPMEAVGTAVAAFVGYREK